MSGSREIARELAQETMLRAHRRWDEVGTHDAPAAWLRRVTSNLLIDHHRSCAAERSAVDRLSSTEAVVVGGPDPTTGWAVLIGPLPPSRRAIVSRFYGEDRSVAEIADILDIAEGTVDQRGARLLRRPSATTPMPADGAGPTGGHRSHRPLSARRRGVYSRCRASGDTHVT